MKDSQSKLRQDLTANAMAYNKYLTKEYLSSKSIEELYCYVSLSEKPEFYERIKKLGIELPSSPNQDA